MKHTKPQNQPSNTNFNANKQRPENKDNLDSRENEEQLTKGDDVTHNKKDHRNTKQDKQADRD